MVQVLVETLIYISLFILQKDGKIEAEKVGDCFRSMANFIKSIAYLAYI